MAGTKTQTEGAPGFVTQSILAATTNLSNSLEGIDVTSLQDRATCFVRENGGLYRFVDTSLAVHSSPTVIRPAGLTAAQAGRWLLESGGAIANSRTAGISHFFATGGTALTGPFGAGSFVVLDPANFTAGPDNSADLAVTALGGRITYNGTAEKLLTVRAGVSCELASTDRLSIGIFHQGVLVATSEQVQHFAAGAAADEIAQLETEAVISIAPGEAVQIRIAELAGSIGVTLYSAYLVVSD